MSTFQALLSTAGWLVLGPLAAFAQSVVDQPHHPATHRATARGASVELHLSDLGAASTEQGSVELRLHDAPAVGEFAGEGSRADGPWPAAVKHDPGRPRKPLWERPGDRSRADAPGERYQLADAVRAGCPQQVAWWARPSTSSHYAVGYVGGSTPRIGLAATRCRAPDEGTWGMDYDGLLPACRVWLAWSCHRIQGGTGAYATERTSGLFSGSLKH